MYKTLYEKRVSETKTYRIVTWEEGELWHFAIPTGEDTYTLSVLPLISKVITYNSLDSLNTYCDRLPREELTSGKHIRHRFTATEAFPTFEDEPGFFDFLIINYFNCGLLAAGLYLPCINIEGREPFTTPFSVMVVNDVVTPTV